MALTIILGVFLAFVLTIYKIAFPKEYREEIEAEINLEGIRKLIERAEQAETITNGQRFTKIKLESYPKMVFDNELEGWVPLETVKDLFSNDTGLYHLNCSRREERELVDKYGIPSVHCHHYNSPSNCAQKEQRKRYSN